MAIACTYDEMHKYRKENKEAIEMFPSLIITETHEYTKAGVWRSKVTYEQQRNKMLFQKHKQKAAAFHNDKGFCC